MKHISNCILGIFASVLAVMCCPAVSAQSPNDAGMLTPGRTWWYGSNSSAGDCYEFGVRIGETKEIDGEQWFTIKTIKEATRGKVLYPYEDWNIKQSDDLCAFIRQDDNCNIIVKFPNNEIFENNNETRSSLLDIWNFTQVCSLGNQNSSIGRDEYQYLIPYNFGNLEDTFALGPDCSLGEYTISNISELENCAISPTYMYTTLHQDEFFGLQEYRYTNQFGIIGAWEGLFFFPHPDEIASSLQLNSPTLRYVTDKDNNILYTAEGGLKLWEMETTGVEGLGVGSPVAEAVYYDLQGRRVAEPAAHGVYIRRQGAKAEKILNVEF